MGGPLLYTKSEAATLRSLFQRWHGDSSHFVSPYQHLQNPRHPEGASSQALPSPALHSLRNRLQENSTGGHGWGPAEHLAVIIPTADSHVLQSRPNEGMLIYIHSQEHNGAHTLTNRGPTRL